MNNTFNIHKQTISEEDKKALLVIIHKQNRTVIRHTFKMPCASCRKEARIERLYKCFYCGVWFCHKCAEEHFVSETEIRTDKLCSGYRIMPDGAECCGCSDCAKEMP